MLLRYELSGFSTCELSWIDGNGVGLELKVRLGKRSSILTSRGFHVSVGARGRRSVIDSLDTVHVYIQRGHRKISYRGNQRTFSSPLTLRFEFLPSVNSAPV